MTGDALIMLEMIICESGQICVTGNANAGEKDFMQVWTNLCDRKRVAQVPKLKSISSLLL